MVFQLGGHSVPPDADDFLGAAKGVTLIRPPQD
jgi:hypothetical protein